MLALAIVSLALELIINIALGVIAFFDNDTAYYIVSFIAFALLSMAIIALVSGIKGIRDPVTRRKSIVITVISAIALVYGFNVGLVGLIFAMTDLNPLDFSPFSFSLD